MQEPTAWETVIEGMAQANICNLTLDELDTLIAAVETVAREDIFPGTSSTPMTSADGFNSSAAVGLASYAAQQLTAAHWQLQFWMARNAFAISLPVGQILNSYTLGARVVMDVYSAAMEVFLLAGATPPAE